MYDLPSGYSCITRSNDGNYLYAYSGSTRDTYGINGFSWQKIASSDYNTIPSSAVCLSGNQYPNEMVNSLILPATIIVLCFFGVILNMFMGVRRR